jgi:hypothetical protein
MDLFYISAQSSRLKGFFIVFVKKIGKSGIVSGPGRKKRRGTCWRPAGQRPARWRRSLVTKAILSYTTLGGKEGYPFFVDRGTRKDLTVTFLRRKPYHESRITSRVGMSRNMLKKMHDVVSRIIPILILD